MQRRTFLQGLLALPLIGAAAKAVAKDSDGLYPWQRDARRAILTGRFSAEGPNPSNIPKKDISHVLYFRRDLLKEKGWDDMKPIMVLRGRQTVPVKIMFLAHGVVDMNKGRVLKDPSLASATWDEKKHQEAAVMALVQAYNYMGPQGPVELTNEIAVKYGLVFDNLRDSRTGETL